MVRRKVFTRVALTTSTVTLVGMAALLTFRPPASPDVSTDTLPVVDSLARLVAYYSFEPGVQAGATILAGLIGIIIFTRLSRPT